MSAPSRDPNFPSNLDIRPLHLEPNDQSDVWKQQDAIKQYGIAGRIWEASHALIDYFTASSSTFSPPCSIFVSADKGKGKKAQRNNIIELGSGQSVASLHLASQLDKEDTLVLTDLPNVVPLMQQSVATWAEQQDKKTESVTIPRVEPMAWGADISHLEKYGDFTHIVCCDLVYFPNLYPPLLRTLLQLTDRSIGEGEAGAETSDDEVFGPEVILAYKSRTLALEQSFFDSLALYFRLEPVVGGQTEAKIYLCRRWRVTGEWAVPGEKDVMNGSKEVIRGQGGYGLMEEMLGAIEWD